MKRTLALSLALIVLASGSYLLTRKSQSSSTGEVEKIETSQPAETSMVNAAKERTPQVEAKVEDSARAEIRRCLGTAADQAKNLGDIVRRLAPDTELHKLRYRNTHIQLRDGTRQRIHLFSDGTPDGKSVMRLRVFSEDAEGLPVPVKIPEEHQVQPDESVLASYASQGEVVYAESAWSAPSLEWVEENGETREFRWVGSDKSLGCIREGSVRCQCRQ